MIPLVPFVAGSAPLADPQRPPLKEIKLASGAKRQRSAAKLTAEKGTTVGSAIPAQAGPTPSGGGLQMKGAHISSRPGESASLQQAREAVGASPPEMPKAVVALKEADHVHTPTPVGQGRGQGCQPLAGLGTTTPRYTTSMPKRPLHGPGGMGKLNIPAGPAFRVPGLRKGGHKKLH
jgi:hypothetical protein